MGVENSEGPGVGGPNTGASSAEGVADEFALSADEDLILTAWQYRMCQRDIAASKGKRAATKRAARDVFRTEALSALAERDGGVYEHLEVAGVASTIRDAAERGDIAEAFAALEEAGPALAPEVSARSRSLLLLIELCGFEPWPGVKWDAGVHRAALVEACGAFPRLRPEDLGAVLAEYRKALKVLKAKGRPWGRYILLGGAGIGLGALTAGLAAPAIAAVYGSAVLGFSGAAATSAGMAALGGGSVAAGGFGMAGGAAVITGVGGAWGLSAAAAGGRVTGFTASRVAADAVRLQVVTQLVLRDAEGNEEAAKAVVVALRERVAAFGKQVGELAAKIEQLRAERDALKAEVEQERQKRLEAESRLAQLSAEVTDRVRERVGRPEDDRLRELDAEIGEVENERKEAAAARDILEASADSIEAQA